MRKAFVGSEKSPVDRRRQLASPDAESQLIVTPAAACVTLTTHSSKLERSVERLTKPHHRSPEAGTWLVQLSGPLPMSWMLPLTMSLLPGPGVRSEEHTSELQSR